MNKLPEPAPQPSRRSLATAAKKRTGGDVRPPLETSCAKKPKPPPRLVTGKPAVKEPSDALMKACEAALTDYGKPPRKEGDRITSKALQEVVESSYTLVGRAGYSFDKALIAATRLLRDRYEALGDAAKANSPLRWLDASAQTKMSSQLPEGRKKRDDEVDAMATEVATAVAAARMAKIKHEVYGRAAVELAGRVLGLHAERTLVEVLRATTVGDMLRERYAPPWISVEQRDVFWKLLSGFPTSMPLYDIKEGPLVATGLPRVDFWIALAMPIAAVAALEPCFASLRPLLKYMCPVHVKKNTPDFGPGGGAHAKAKLTSGVEAHARRFLNLGSSIVRGEGALRRSPTDAHTFAPRGVAPDKLPLATEGVIANVSLEMKNGELAVAGLFIGDTWREIYDFGDDNTRSVTTFTTEAAEAGHGEGRDCLRYERENAFDHSPAAALLAATLNVRDLALVSSWVLREVFDKPPPSFIRQLYQESKAVEWAQHALAGVVLELATRCPLVAADLRFEFDRNGGAYDSELLASCDALLQRLRERGAKLEWKAVVDGAARVVHGASGLVGTARRCDLVVWTDTGSGASAIRATDAPFCGDNLDETLKEAHDLHAILDVLSTSDARDEACGKFLKQSTVLRKARVAFCFIGDLDKKGIPLEAQTRRVSFAADWAVVKRDICDAIDYCLERRDAWRAATPPSWETRSYGPRVVTADPIKLVPPTGAGVAADIYQSAPPAPPLVVQPRGAAGGLAGLPKPPPLRTPKARLAPWEESVTKFCDTVAPPKKKKARRKK